MSGPVARLWHERIKPVGNTIQVDSEQAGVDVERHSRRSVPQHLLYDLHVRSRLDSKGGRGVPKSCGLRPSSPAVLHAGSNTFFRQLSSRNVLPSGEVKIKSSCALPLHRSPSMAANRAVTGTDRLWWVFGVVHTS